MLQGLIAPDSILIIPRWPCWTSIAMPQIMIINGLYQAWNRMLRWLCKIRLPMETCHHKLLVKNRWSKSAIQMWSSWISQVLWRIIQYRTPFCPPPQIQLSRTKIHLMRSDQHYKTQCRTIWRQTQLWILRLLSILLMQIGVAPLCHPRLTILTRPLM